VLIALSSATILGALSLGKQGAYLAQVYMLCPAIAAIITRVFFYPPRFSDANLRFGKVSDYLRFWLYGLGITMISASMYTAFGAISWDFSGQLFLERLSKQFADAGQDMAGGLPEGFTPEMMLWIYFVGGLTIFNILPGVISGFGEEFGHRGLMFPLLYRISPRVAFIGGGLIWYAWHWPLVLVMPDAPETPLWQDVLNFIVLAIGSLCTFAYLAYVYVKSQSVWVASVAHISMNNAAASISYFSVLENQLLANLGLSLTMIVLVFVLYKRGEFKVFKSLDAS